MPFYITDPNNTHAHHIPCTPQFVSMRPLHMLAATNTRHYNKDCMINKSLCVQIIVCDLDSSIKFKHIARHFTIHVGNRDWKKSKST